MAAETSSKVEQNNRTNRAPKTGSSKKRKQKNKRSWQRDQEDYFNRLLYSAQKELRKQAKLVRNLESQKMVRKIKERKSDGQSEIETTYQQLKQLDLEHVVQESLRRLGILHLDPKLTEAVANEDSENADEQKKSPDENQSKASKPNELSKTVKNEKELVEKILKHKKLQCALEEWNEKVTEYRRWSLQQQERESPTYRTEITPASKKSKKRKASTKAAMPTAQSAAEEGQKSLFLCLGEEKAASSNMEDEDMPHYGPGSFAEEKKKNRMGQRQRKAKRQAIEAKKAGRVHRAAESVNWRKKKSNHTSEEEWQPTGTRHTGGQVNSPVVQSGANKGHTASSETEKLHPSWAAAKKESSGIVQFQGKKITF